MSDLVVISGVVIVPPDEFVRLSVMNNVAIKAEKIIEKIGKCWE